MPSTRCAHQLSLAKKQLRVRSLVAFAKNAQSPAQLSTKLLDVWSCEHATITEVRILLVLGANPAKLYEDEHGARMLEERMLNGTLCPNCAARFQEFLDKALAIHQAQFEQEPMLSSLRDHGGSRQTTIAMSLDGGGMRGLVSIVCLLFASRRLLGDESLPDLVDWTVGTSTGSMLGLALAKGRRLSELFHLYWAMKDEIFLDASTVSRLFGSIVDRQTSNLDAVLDKCFDPTDTFLTCRKRLTVPALNIATTPARLHVFRNYSLSLNDNQVDDVSFRDAARASSAAPTYFHPHVIDDAKLVDGSFVANCPLNILFQEYDRCARHGAPIRLGAVISIGTGEPKPIERKYKSGTTIRTKGRHLLHMSELLLEQVVGHEKSALSSAIDRCLAQDIPFVRLSPTGISVRINPIDDEKLMAMVWDTLLYCLESVHDIDRLGRIIIQLTTVDLPRQRSNTVL